MLFYNAWEALCLHRKYNLSSYYSVATDYLGTVIFVHASENHLKFDVGVMDSKTQQMQWKSHSEYGNGSNPQIALGPDGLMIEIHQEKNNTLVYRMARMDSETFDITWGDETDSFAHGNNCAIAMHGHYVVAIYEKNNQLECRIGEIPCDKAPIRWGKKRNCGKGMTPSIAVTQDGRFIIQEHVEKRTFCYLIWAKDVIYYSIWAVDWEKKSITRKAYQKNDSGIVPNIKIASNGEVLDHHLAKEKGESWYRRGSTDNEVVSWNDTSSMYHCPFKTKKNNFDRFYNRGYAKYLIGDYLGALVDFNHATEAQPNQAKAWYYAGLIKYILKDYQNAMVNFDKVLQLDPCDKDALYYKACVQYELNKVDEARDTLNQLVKKEESDRQKISDLFCKIGNAQSLLDKFDVAVDCFNQALELNSSNLHAYTGRGWAQLCLLKFQQAKEDSKKSGSAVANINFTIATLFLLEEEEKSVATDTVEMNLGFSETAWIFAEEFSKIDLSYIDQKKLISWMVQHNTGDTSDLAYQLYRGFANIASGSFLEALENFNHCLSHHKNLNWLYALRGYARVLTGDFSEAISDFITYLSDNIDGARHFVKDRLSFSIIHANKNNIDLTALKYDHNQTLLHCLCKKIETADLVKQLIKVIRDTDDFLSDYILATDDDNKTAFMLAKENDNDEIAALLLDIVVTERISACTATLDLNNEVAYSITRAGNSDRNVVANNELTEETQKKLSSKKTTAKIDEYEKEIQETEELLKKSPDELTDEETIAIEKLPLVRSEAMNLSMEEFQNNIKPGLQLTVFKPDQDIVSKNTTSIGILEGFLGSSLLSGKISYLSEALSILEVIRRFNTGESLDFVALNNIAKTVYRVGVPRSNLRFIGGLVGGVLSTFKFLNDPSFELIFEPISMFYSVFAERFGGDRAMSIAVGLHEFVRTIPVSSYHDRSHMTLQDYVRRTCDFARSTQSDIVHNASLLLSVDFRKKLKDIRAKGQDLDTVLAKLIYTMVTINIYQENEVLEEQVKKVVTDHPSNALNLEGYDCYKHILVLLHQVAKTREDNYLEEIVETADRLLDQAVSEEHRRSVKRWILLIQLFARAMIKQRGENDSILSNVGIFCFLSCELFMVRENIKGKNNYFDQIVEILHSSKNCLSALRGIFVAPEVRIAEAIIIVCEMLVKMLGTITNPTAKKVDVNYCLNAMRLAIDGQAARILLISDDACVQKIGNSIRYLEIFVTGSTAVKLMVDLVGSRFGWNFLKRISTILPSSDAIEPIKKTFSKGVEQSPKALVALTKKLPSVTGQAVKTAGSTAGSAAAGVVSGVFSVFTAVLSVVEIAATIYYGKKTLRVLREKFAEMEDKIDQLEHKFLAAIKKLQEAFDDRSMNQHRAVMEGISELNLVIHAMEDSLSRLERQGIQTYQAVIDTSVKSGLADFEGPLKSYIESGSNIDIENIADKFVMIFNQNENGTNVFNQYISGLNVFRQYESDQNIIFKFTPLTLLDALGFFHLQMKRDMEISTNSVSEILLPNLSAWMYLTQHLLSVLVLTERKKLFSTSLIFNFLYRLINQGVEIIAFLDLISSQDCFNRFFTMVSQSSNETFLYKAYLLSLYSTLMGVPLSGYGEPDSIWRRKLEEVQQWVEMLSKALINNFDVKNSHGPLANIVFSVRSLVRSLVVITKSLLMADDFPFDSNSLQMSCYRELLDRCQGLLSEKGLLFNEQEKFFPVEKNDPEKAPALMFFQHNFSPSIKGNLYVDPQVTNSNMVIKQESSVTLPGTEKNIMERVWSGLVSFVKENPWDIGICGTLFSMLFKMDSNTASVTPAMLNKFQPK